MATKRTTKTKASTGSKIVADRHGNPVEVLHFVSAGLTRDDPWIRAADNHAAADHAKLFPEVR